MVAILPVPRASDVQSVAAPKAPWYKAAEFSGSDRRELLHIAMGGEF